MRRLILVLLPSFVLGCAWLSGLGLSSPQTPAAIFETAEVAYSSALESAIGYARFCSSQAVITSDCDTFIVKVRDTNRQAQEVLFLGGLLSTGVSRCDEAADPGCTARELSVLAARLGELASAIARKGD